MLSSVLPSVSREFLFLRMSLFSAFSLLLTSLGELSYTHGFDYPLRAEKGQIGIFWSHLPPELSTHVFDFPLDAHLCASQT